jgi:Peptidase family M28
MKQLWIAALSALALPFPLAAQRVGLAEASATITEADYMQRLGVIAHDSMQGRDTPSSGLEKTAAFVASEFRGFGLRGGAEDGGFLQRYPLRSVVVDSERSSLSGGPRKLEFGRDIAPLLGTDEGGEASGGLVLVSGSQNMTPALADDAVRGQHAVLILGGDAQGVDQDALRLLLTIRNAGAASVLVAMDTNDATWWANATRSLRPAVAKGWGPATSPLASGSFRPILVIRTRSLQDLVRGRNVDLAGLQARASQAMRVDRVPGLRLVLTQRQRDQQITAPNVVGILDGSDASLKGEYVVFSAHMDHIGIGAPDENGDSIFNGADDDGSGTTAVTEIAKAMSSLSTRPKRSLIFLLVSGEEKGLWGSEYFTDHPTVPIDSIVADLNTDMVGRNWPDTIVAIGREHSDLGETLTRVNVAHPELGMTAIDDLWPEESFYTRSDHYNFARKGVPILFFFNGTHEDYHGRDDEIDRINGEKAARIARLVFYLGAEIADTRERPKWNPDSYRAIVGGGRAR